MRDRVAVTSHETGGARWAGSRRQLVDTEKLRDSRELLIRIVSMLTMI